MKRHHAGYLKVAVNIFVVVLVVLVLFSIPQSAVAADPPSIEGRKTYSGIRATSVIQTSDGGYAIAGAASSPSGASLIKCDSSGNIQWQKNFGTVISLEETRDLTYVLFLENGDVTKIDTQGNILFTFSVGAKGLRQGILAVDGDYIITGNDVWRGGPETYVWLRKFDPQGNIVWNLNYTGGFQISSITNTVNRGCVMAGNWKNNFWLARLDTNGNTQWSQNYVYGDPLDAHYVYAVAGTNDGGFILSGTGMWQSSGGMIPWLIKINPQGYEQWNLPYAQYHDSFSAIAQSDNGGYFVVRPGAATLMGADSSGSEIWQKQLGTSSIIDVGEYPAACLIPTNDGGYALAGSTFENAFLIKFSPQVTSQSLTVSISRPQSTTYDTHDVPLTFTVNDQSAQLSYVLDSQQEVAITGNTTLTNLPAGTHNITVYVRNSAGLTDASEVILFTIADRFPSEILFAGIASVIAVSISLLLYLKRQNLSNFKKGDLWGILKKKHRPAFIHNKLVWTLLIISTCFALVFVQLFFPYSYYAASSMSRNSDSFEVGITYVYERDSVDQIYDEVSHLKELGFSVIRVNLVCDSSNPASILNTLSDVFFSAVRQLGMKVALIINGHATPSNIKFYLDSWGSDLAYIQILNEPDVASSWDMGALFTDDEAGSKFEDIYTAIENHQLSAKLYTNFSPAYIVRTNLPIKFSEKLDFVGFDVFMDSFLTLSPNMIQFLQKITNKEVVISEFGMSTSDDATQSSYIINGLNLFRNMGLRGCWIVYWNDADNHYGIRGRLAEQKVGEWIAQNV